MEINFGVFNIRDEKISNVLAYNDIIHSVLLLNGIVGYGKFKKELEIIDCQADINYLENDDEYNFCWENSQIFLDIGVHRDGTCSYYYYGKNDRFELNRDNIPLSNVQNDTVFNILNMRYLT